MTKPLIFGISGYRLTEEEKDLFTKNEICGFIVFKRNIESREQVVELIGSLRTLYPDRRIPIFVDQEGERVARIKPPIVERLYLSLEMFSRMYDNESQGLALSAVKDNHC